MAVHLLCSSKKGMSSHQIHRILGVTYKTAWFMTHRIREAMADTTTDKLGGAGSSGVVEADETSIGKVQGRGKGPHGSKKQKVVALVERGGRVRAFHVQSVNSETLGQILSEQVSGQAKLMTDAALIYTRAASGWDREAVNHSQGEYSRGLAHTNSVDGFFGILKRGLHGVYQHVDSRHLHRYVDEFGFRYSQCRVTDEERTDAALRGIPGKRLTYRDVTARAGTAGS
jgi:hypothetical protein